ncbi:MAG: hypothetical protein J3R72DRAFT_422650 [Linnemannia gamsii]|nr:MAG: hypothetical protein J3R72DRAFT_422650 [Linnemannia gamsii]
MAADVDAVTTPATGLQNGYKDFTAAAAADPADAGRRGGREDKEEQVVEEKEEDAEGKWEECCGDGLDALLGLLGTGSAIRLVNEADDDGDVDSNGSAAVDDDEEDEESFVDPGLRREIISCWLWDDDHGRNHVYALCVAVAPLLAGSNGVVASDVDCCEGVGVGVTKKCGYIDHPTAASTDSLLPSHLSHPHLPLPSPDNGGSVSEEIGIGVVEMNRVLGQGDRDTFLEEEEEEEEDEEEDETGENER